MRIQSVFGIVALSTLFVGSARADEGSCHEQVSKLCAGMEPGDGKLHECVKAHKSELTPDCQAKIDKIHAKIEEVLAVCATDLKEKCADIVPGGGRKLMCLAAHEPTLSPACAAAVKNGKKKFHALRACRDDARTLCPNVPRHGGGVKACLEAHRAELSPACGAVFSEG
jgi:Golgi apparatus protein 1